MAKFEIVTHVAGRMILEVKLHQRWVSLFFHSAQWQQSNEHID